MRFGWSECGSAAAVIALGLLAASASNAAEPAGIRTAAEELGSRTVEAPADAPKDKLSDSAVRVMSTFALSILPDEIPDGHGGMVKLDKSNPNLYLVPIDDARQVIRVATRSAYAEVCGLLELEKANYNTLMRTEQLRNVWTEQQLMFIRALHTFATSYFAGNVKITEQPDDPAAAGAKPTDGKAAPGAASGASTTITTKKLTCSEEQKAKVAQAIQTYADAGPKRLPPPLVAPGPMGATQPLETTPAEAPGPLESSQFLPTPPAEAPQMAPAGAAPVAGGAN